MERSDEALVDDTLAGELSAYDALMERHQRMVYGVAYRFARERETALDITQTVFLKAWDGLSGFRRGASFKSWLASIAYHEGINWHRRQGRREAGRDALDVESLPAPRTADPERTALATERRRRLQRGLVSLGERDRQAISLRYLEGLPVREVAQVLGVSVGATKSILFRGVRRLQEAVGEAPC